MTYTHPVARPASIDRAQILDATLALAEEQGLEAVTMRAVATRLGVTPMALYRHVGDKQGLLDGLVERVLDEIPAPDPAQPWDARLRELGLGLRAVARRHPDVFLMLFRRPAATPQAVRTRDGVYDALREAGVPERDVPRAERLLSTFFLGWAASEAGGRFAHHEQQTLDADLAWVEEQIAAVVRSTATGT
jgi:AcrR family transcriptional regulator